MKQQAAPETVEADWEELEGSPYPLGVSFDRAGKSMNFALYTKHALEATLLFFDEQNLLDPVYRLSFDKLKNKSGPIWHCRIPLELIARASYYAYQVDGPTLKSGYHWHMFDPAKLLLDPYARAVYFPPRFSRESAEQPGSNLGRAPLGMLDPCIADDLPPPLKRQRRQFGHVIYEMHVRGFTKRAESGVSPEHRGTFRGVVEKIPYLQALGVTTVELMPVFQGDPQLNDYWGYMPLNFFSPHQGYVSSAAACSPSREFREMVAALHAAGIEVILDVVYNHTCEGNQAGPCYSFKGIDNSSYYMMTGDLGSPYANYSGTGNTLHTANRAVRRLIIDSLRYWVEELGVDGFRFDLASIFSRCSDGSINLQTPPIFDQIAGNAAFDGVHLIAEPWDASGLYQLGSRFPGLRWMQWNARYRDTLQRFVRGDNGMVPDLMTRVYGSSDLFPDDVAHAYRPYQSVNYVTSHDGFTLYDLVSYDQKHNWPNGENNTDGMQDYSWNCGCEGNDSLTAAITQLRQRQVKNFFALLMLSNGTPMFRMGDEFLQTQHGNSNPYNQDNETTWLDWRLLEQNRDMFRFVSRLIAFRRSHVSIWRPHFWRTDVAWCGPQRPVDMSNASHTLAYCIHGSECADDDIYLMVNAGPTQVQFGIHEGSAGSWRRAVDTAQPSPADIADPGDEATIGTPFYEVQGRSVVVLVRPRQTMPAHQ